ncbi:MAG: exosortase/archaeosortase family protein [Planctomycetota bacterium]
MTTVPTSSAAGGSARQAARGQTGLDVVSVCVAVLLSVAFVAVFFRWFAKQAHFSSVRVEDWGHAFFMPVIAGYLIWQRRRIIASTSPTTFWPGLVPVVLGIIGYLTFSIGPFPGQHMFQGFAVVLSAFGIVLTLFGPSTTRHLAMPLLLLLLGVTVAERVMLEITWPLQQIASQGAFVMLGVIGLVFGFQTEVEGNVLTIIDTAGVEYPLNVAQACSGMRMVVAFIALGATVAVLTCRLWWQRIAVVLMSVPVALFMNIIRVAVLGLLTLQDPDLAQGEAHTFIGTLLLFPGLGLFLVLVWALQKLIELPPEQKPEPCAFAPRLARPAAFVLLGVMSVSALGIGWAIDTYEFHLTKKAIYAPGNRPVASLPRETDSWVQLGQDRIESAEVLEELGTTNYLNRLFIEKEPPAGREPRVIELHAAYYTNQIDTVPHVPERCFIGGGMQRAEESIEIPMNLDSSRWVLDPNVPDGTEPVYTARTSTKWSDSRGQRVRLPEGIEKVRLRTSGYSIPRQGKLFAGYFFIANGGVTSSAEGVRLLAYELEDDYAFYLKVQFNAVGDESFQTSQDLVDAASGLLGELLPDLMLCVPDWVEVEQGRYPLPSENEEPRIAGGVDRAG